VAAVVDPVPAPDSWPMPEPDSCPVPELVDVEVEVVPVPSLANTPEHNNAQRSRYEHTAGHRGARGRGGRT
jgi:hypothetical protein